MEKQKRWQLVLIVTVVVLTLYNILPTIFYYSNSLHSPVGESQALSVAEQVVERVNGLEEDSVDWVQAYCKHLGLHPDAAEISDLDPRLILVHFKHSGEANTFRRLLPKAGSMIPFQPAHLGLSVVQPQDSTIVSVERRIGVHLDSTRINDYFTHDTKLDADGQPTALYSGLVFDRLAELALAVGGQSTEALQVQALLSLGSQITPDQSEIALRLARSIVSYDEAFGSSAPLSQRFFGRFSLAEGGANQAQLFAGKLDAIQKQLENERDALVKERDELKAKDALQDVDKTQLLRLVEGQVATLNKASQIVRREAAAFQKGLTPLERKVILATLSTSEEATIDLGDRHPFFQTLDVDWGADRINITVHQDVAAIQSSAGKSELDDIQNEKLHQLLINEVAQLSRFTDETLAPRSGNFVIALNELTDSTSILTFNLDLLASQQAQQLHHQLGTQWNPVHPDLQRDVYPVLDYDAFTNLSTREGRLGLVVYAPAVGEESPDRGFRTNSIYVIARGMKNIVDKYQAYPESEEAQELLKDVNQLKQILGDQGFFGYPAAAYGFDQAYAGDFIFELNDYYSNILSASREDFVVKGSNRKASLEMSTVEQRVLTTNRIEEECQEELLKWREEYQSAQVSLQPSARLLVPAPTKNVFVENIKLNWRKYFRGDDRKILRWGLDLSGGKSVRIGLRDQSNQAVTDPEDLKQAVNELYTRINKMGVAERSIRIENSNILLDFPGVQGLSADDLVKASAMYFHIVNEKFSLHNPSLRDATNTFLQEVWNEAVVTNRKGAEDINQIAWEHLGGDIGDADGFRPRSESARTLYDQGLRLADPRNTAVSNTFDDTTSAIALWRGEDYTDWHGQSHPLVITFRNYALEGANLTNVQGSYDPNHGNILTFGVRSSYLGKGQTGDPRSDFHAWTSQFAKSKVLGTVREAYSRGEGWRMAVILNGSVINAPTLSEALKDQAMIHGNFSQREVSRLVADLKAGSLSFTPRVLSETNVSPDLGQEERFWGITAAIVGLFAVVVAMVSYYRFAGIVASCAVLFNLLIMWGVLQNLGAALTLPGIAAIILTVGMAVDANVLVFERIREEFKVSGRIASAVSAGYQKAFSAILDSNITTIIAALILIQFDSGPVRGFATTLIIGVCSSMFTALFVTRYFFAGWVSNPKNTHLNMSELLGNVNFDFLSRWKIAASASLVIIAVGGTLLYGQWQSILGMDFTGGYAVTVRLEDKGNVDYRNAAVEAFTAAGALAGDVEVRELNKPNQLRIQMGFSIEEEGHPFALMSERTTVEEGQPAYLKNPRLTWVVQALENADLELQAGTLPDLDKNWTLMSGQFSDVMRNNALLALGCAMLSILVYLTFRFEFKYAISAIIALGHDVLVTFSLLGILYKLGVPIQINLEVIGAVMTIIGYSLNDTIIIFDRIREDVRLMKKKSFSEVVNHALNVTLSRTLITSGTTVLVLFALVGLGGSAIFDLALVMTIGVVFGTVSSLFIASPIMLFFHEREEKQHETMLRPKKA